jgi:hypothetical protein
MQEDQSTPSPRLSSASSSGKAPLSPPEAPAGTCSILKVPFDTPSYGVKADFTTMTKDQYDESLTTGSFVSEDVHDVLRYLEVKCFKERAAKMEVEKRVLDSLVSPIADRIVILNSHDWHVLLIHASDASKSEWGRLSTRWKLFAYTSFDLMSIPVMSESGGHFSNGMWLPAIDKIVHGDTAPGCGHLSRTEHYFKPFVEFAKGDESTVEVVSAKNVEVQKKDSNVCAFTSAKILNIALSKLLEIYEREKTDDAFSEIEDEFERAEALAQARQQELFDYLTSITLRADMYEKYRRMANSEIASLVSDYASHRKKKLDSKAQGPPSKVPKGTEASSPSSPLILSEDDNNDDDDGDEGCVNDCSSMGSSPPASDEEDEEEDRRE